MEKSDQPKEADLDEGDFSNQNSPPKQEPNSHTREFLTKASGNLQYTVDENMANTMRNDHLIQFSSPEQK